MNNIKMLGSISNIYTHIIKLMVPSFYFTNTTKNINIINAYDYKISLMEEGKLK
jgi:hypothetical protein